MKLKARGITYHIQKHTENEELPDLVLLHGFLGSGKVFDSIISDLSKFCNPITIDLLGHGESEGAELHYQFSTKEQVGGLVHIFNSLFDKPFFLYGYSMGGRLALQFAINHSHKLNGLILESATFGIESEQERIARQSLDAERADHILGNFSSFLEEWKTMPLFQSSKTDGNLESIHKQQNPLWMANSLLGFGTGTMPFIKNQLHQVSCPSLLVAGERDTKFCSINSAMSKSITSCDFYVIADSGHRIHIDNPKGLLNYLQIFIENHLTL